MLNKEAVAVLNGAQQHVIAGGAIITRVTATCDVTRDATCETFRYTEDMCILC